MAASKEINGLMHYKFKVVDHYSGGKAHYYDKWLTLGDALAHSQEAVRKVAEEITQQVVSEVHQQRYGDIFEGLRQLSEFEFDMNNILFEINNNHFYLVSPPRDNYNGWLLSDGSFIASMTQESLLKNAKLYKGAVEKVDDQLVFYQGPINDPPIELSSL